MKTVILTSLSLAAAAVILTQRVCAAPGDVDSSFSPNAGGEADSVAVQPDGKLVVVGDFSTMSGSPRLHIARLTPGSLDTTFNPGADFFTRSVAVQSDGKLLITGMFTALGGLSRNRIARVTAAGAIETAFDPNLDADPHCAALQRDGKILLGGMFTTVGGVSRSRFARLLPNGSLDTPFNAPVNGGVLTIRVLEDDRILLCGGFTTVNGTPRQNIARLHPDGTVDQGFNASVNNIINTMALQADGKIVIGGVFTQAGGQTRTRLARLLPNGELDPSFDASASDRVRSITVQTDGRILIVGDFLSVNGTSRSRLARLLSTGALDPGFSTTAVSGGIVHGLTLQPDGKIVIAGHFTTVGTLSRPRLARLQNDAVTQSLTAPTPGRIQWLRGGASPETHEVTFEVSTNGGTAWTPLPRAERISGGWEVTKASLPAAGLVRARARVACGLGTGSFGLYESTAAFSFSALQMWRHTHFALVDETGSAANNADPDKDGLENVVEYAFGLDPNVPDAASLPAWEKDDDVHILTFTRPAGVSSVTYVAEYSTNLAANSWVPAASAAAAPDYVFHVQAAGPRLYLRLRVSVP